MDELLVTGAPVVDLETFSDWLALKALPLWSSDGVAADGGFHESLNLDGTPTGADRRARVQARQVWSFCRAGALGWKGPWRDVAAAGLETFHRQFRREDGLYRTLVSAGGAPLDETAMIYDQAFVLLALSETTAAGISPEDSEARAEAIRLRLATEGHAFGGWRESGSRPFQSNAHMHLLEAALAWETLRPTRAWSALSDEIVDLALTRFIHPGTGFLHEYFDAEWRPAPDAEDRIVEPGHQCEWAWLLTRYARVRHRAEIAEAAQRLLERGLSGLDARRGVLVDQLDADGGIARATARLWPQTEWLKAAAIQANPINRPLQGVAGYLVESGLWRDCKEADGRFIEEAAPASSFYHLMAAFETAAMAFESPLG